MSIIDPPQNGSLLYNIAYIVTPSAQMSLALPDTPSVFFANLPLNTLLQLHDSGAKNWYVPAVFFSMSFVPTRSAVLKSVSLAVPSAAISKF